MTQPSGDATEPSRPLDTITGVGAPTTSAAVVRSHRSHRGRRPPVFGITAGAALLAAAVTLGTAIALLHASSAWLAVIPLGVLVLAWAAWWLVQRPTWALAVAVIAIIALEDDPQGILPVTQRFYARFSLMRLSPADLVLLIALGALALDCARSRRPPLGPGPFSLPLMLMVVAITWGVIVGRFNGGATVDMLNSLRTLVILILVPILVVNAVRTREDLRRATTLGAVLAVAKGVEGLAAWLLGVGRPLDGIHITYYEPAPNLLALLLVLSVFAAFLLQGRVSGWTAGAGVICLASLLLSLRRSFWIALVLGIVIALLATTGRWRRPLLLLSGVAVLLAVVIGLRAGGGTNTSAISTRIQSLTSSQLSSNAEDAYRLGEQRNVEAALQRNPVTGLGLGVAWDVRYPLTENYVGGQNYTHVVAFWWWLKLGLPGLMAWAALAATAIGTGLRVGRSDPSPWASAFGLGTTAAVVGMLAAETTGSFTGVDQRYSTVIGAAFGLLAVARRTMGDRTMSDSVGGPPSARPASVR